MYSGAAKWDVLRRLDDASATNLADLLGIPQHDVRTFGPGQAGRTVWDWLENRGRLGELPYALRGVAREDLAQILESAPATDPGTSTGAVPVVSPPPSPRSGRAWTWAPALVVLVLLAVVVGVVLEGAHRSGSAQSPGTGYFPQASTVPAASPSPVEVDPSWPVSADQHPCQQEVRPAGKQELPYRCPMLWEVPGVTLATAPVFDGYRTPDLTPASAVDQLLRGQPQYFNCQVKGARYLIGPQPGASGARLVGVDRGRR